MTIVDQPKLMTTEEFLAIPDDGVDRWLIDGRVREFGRGPEDDVTKRNRGHSRIEANITHLLRVWRDTHAARRGEVLVGEAGFRLRRNPETTVGIDVAYVSEEITTANSDDDRIVEGAPLLAVEVLSPSDHHEGTSDKITTYLESGVKIVWIVDPFFQTVTVFRPDSAPALFNTTQEIDGGTWLPGFRVPVREFFAR